MFEQQNLIEFSNFRNISTAGERAWRRLWKYLSTDVFESYSVYKKNSIDRYRLEIEKIIGKHDCLGVNKYTGDAQIFMFIARLDASLYGRIYYGELT